MACHQINDNKVAEASLQDKLQTCVQSLQWTYSVFWQLCPPQGTLVWGDGYYNGAIKTRKMVQPVETTAEEAALQRSQQLRELFESLAMGEDSQQSRRPCAALSPEDLTELEWFYLLSISFVFPPGVGLPGRAFERQQTVWLVGANEVDSKTFSRAILAKGAQIQTVICIPIADGVLELGTTDWVEEDHDKILQMQSFFSGYQNTMPAVSELSSSVPAGWRRCLTDSFAASPAEVQRYDDDDDDDEDEGPNSEEILIQTPMTEEILIGTPDDGSNDMDDGLKTLAMTHAEELYSQTVSAVLQQNPSRSCHVGNPSSQSAFSTWTVGATVDGRRAPQCMLKQVLRSLHGGRPRKRGVCHVDELSASHVMAERRRREKLNEKFVALRAMVPCVTKMDKASILGDTIEYLTKLQRRIEDLEVQVKVAGTEQSIRNEPEKKKKMKMKGMDVQTEFCGETSLEVSIIEADALLELVCPNRSGLLLCIMQTIQELGLESSAVQSSVAANVLVAQIRAKVEKGSMGTVPSIVEVKKALHRLIIPYRP
ncbi:basic helix-loop-helix (bHLH) DNA-binding superfamily protein [Wolffia australiana]